MRSKTELQGVKSVAHMLLSLDIELTKFSPMVVSHPFTNSGISGIIGEDGGLQIADLVNKPDDLAKWRSQVRRQIDSADSAYGIYTLVNKPYALTFLKFAQPYLSEQDFGQFLSSAWTLSEAPNGDANMTRRELISAFRSVAPEYLMDEEELRQYQELEDTVTVYRGVTPHNAKNIKALSWTLDRDVAEWFAHRFGENGTVYEAQIDKNHIFALFTGRNESEVIVNPNYLMDIKEAPELEQGPTLTM